jgi:SAM-dependent methyltransferase
MSRQPDRQFVEPALASMYDAFCAGRPDFGFYLPLVMAAGSVLDIGCGTGELLRLARAAGHTGRLCGIDPAAAMLACARVRGDVEWIQGDVCTTDLNDRYDLVVMTGHAFQVLVDDTVLRDSLAAIRSRLADRGRFVFETRNPEVREWERWTPERAVEVVDPEGAVVRMAHSVDRVEGDRVTFNVTYTSSSWDAPEVSRTTLRFLDAASLSAFLVDAGLAIEEQFGDWDRRPVGGAQPLLPVESGRRGEHRPGLTIAHPEIITVARPARRQGLQSGFS